MHHSVPVWIQVVVQMSFVVTAIENNTPQVLAVTCHTGEVSVFPSHERAVEYLLRNLGYGWSDRYYVIASVLPVNVFTDEDRIVLLEEELRHAKHALSDIREDTLRGFRIAHSLTLETQTVAEMTADLVRIIRMAREQRDAEALELRIVKGHATRLRSALRKVIEDIESADCGEGYAFNLPDLIRSIREMLSDPQFGGTGKKEK